MYGSLVRFTSLNIALAIKSPHSCRLIAISQSAPLAKVTVEAGEFTGDEHPGFRVAGGFDAGDDLVGLGPVGVHAGFESLDLLLARGVGHG